MSCCSSRESCWCSAARSVSVSLSPSIIPALSLQPIGTLRNGPRLAPRSPSVSNKALRQPKVRLALKDGAAVVRPTEARPSVAPLTVGYFVNWDEASFSSLKANLEAIDLLVPEWLHVYGPDGGEEDDAEYQIDILEYIRESGRRFASCRWSTTTTARPLIRKISSASSPTRSPACRRHRPDVEVREGPRLRRVDHRF